MSQKICKICDLTVDVSELKSGQMASCPRCGAYLYHYEKNSRHKSVSYAISAMIFLFIGVMYYFIGINVAGVNAKVTLLEIPPALIFDKAYFLVYIYIIFVFILPFSALSIIILFGMRLKVGKSVKVLLLKALKTIEPWCMSEIFIIGTLVSFIKLQQYGTLSVGISFSAYCLFAIFTIKAIRKIDYKHMWDIVQPSKKTALTSGMTGKDQGVWQCDFCGEVSDKLFKRCFRCGSKGHSRKPQSVQKTIAFLIAAFVFYIPANFFPVMTSSSLTTPPFASTIVSGAIYMWKEGSYFVGMIIFVASILIPSFKILCLSMLCFYTRSTELSLAECVRLSKVYKIILAIGRWSMIDVFVIIVLSGLVKMTIMNVHYNIGIVYFAMVVIITMVAAELFDPRLIWDKLRGNNEQ